MQPDRSNWRDQAAYDYLDDLAAPELGWECLRRNPEYQDDCPSSNDLEHAA